MRRMKLSSDVLTRLSQESLILEEFVTGDETWTIQYISVSNPEFQDWM
jgi:hypothetical protein